jgi:hypothetical protein
LLGFLGTVIGISQAIGSLGDALTTGNLKFQDIQLHEAFGQVALAFETTALGFIGLLLLSICESSLQAWTDHALGALRSWVHETRAKLATVSSGSQLAQATVTLTEMSGGLTALTEQGEDSVRLSGALVPRIFLPARIKSETFWLGVFDVGDRSEVYWLNESKEEWVPIAPLRKGVQWTDFHWLPDVSRLVALGAPGQVGPIIFDITFVATKGSDVPIEANRTKSHNWFDHDVDIEQMCFLSPNEAMFFRKGGGRGLYWRSPMVRARPLSRPEWPANAFLGSWRGWIAVKRNEQIQMWRAKDSDCHMS